MGWSCSFSVLGEVVGGADQGPFGADVVEASQQELSEPPGLLDLSEDRLDDLLSEPVSTSPSCPLELVAHGLGERPGDLAFAVGGVFGPPGRDVSADLAISQGLEVGFAAIAGIGRGFFWLAPEIVFDAIDQRHELIMVARALRQAMGDDDLRRTVHGGLRIEALDVAVLGLQDAALRIGEVALRLAVGLLARRRRLRAGLFAACRLALLLGRRPPLSLLLGGG